MMFPSPYRRSSVCALLPVLLASSMPPPSPCSSAAASPCRTAPTGGSAAATSRASALPKYHHPQQIQPPQPLRHERRRQPRLRKPTIARASGGNGNHTNNGWRNRESSSQAGSRLEQLQSELTRQIEERNRLLSDLSKVSVFDLSNTKTVSTQSGRARSMPMTSSSAAPVAPASASSASAAATTATTTTRTKPSIPPSPRSSPMGGSRQNGSSPMGGSRQNGSSPMGGSRQNGSSPIGGSRQNGSSPIGGSRQNGSSPIGSSRQNGSSLIGGSRQNGSPPSPAYRNGAPRLANGIGATAATFKSPAIGQPPVPNTKWSNFVSPNVDVEEEEEEQVIEEEEEEEEEEEYGVEESLETQWKQAMERTERYAINAEASVSSPRRFAQKVEQFSFVNVSEEEDDQYSIQDRYDTLIEEEVEEEFMEEEEEEEEYEEEEEFEEDQEIVSEDFQGDVIDEHYADEASYSRYPSPDYSRGVSTISTSPFSYNSYSQPKIHMPTVDTFVQEETVQEEEEEEAVAETAEAAAPSDDDDDRVPTERLNIVLVGAECAPWSKTGGLGDVVGSLPKAFAKLGHRVMCIAPRYANYAEGWDTKVRIQFNVKGQTFEVGYFHGYIDGVDFIFVDHPVFHGYEGNIYGGSREDLLCRLQLFCRAAIEAPLMVPCGGCTYGDENLIYLANDWHTALLPVYLQAYYRDHSKLTFSRAALVLHNIAHQGRAPMVEYELLDLPETYMEDFRLYDPIGGEHMNILMAGIKYATRVIAVSGGYCWETKTQEGGWGLDSILRESEWKYCGIVNGIGADWDPETDEFLNEKEGYMKFTVENFEEGKAANKAALQKELGLPQRPDVPLIGFIGRLDYQKGVDLIQESMPWLMSNDVQFIMLGTGRQELEEFLRSSEGQNQDKVRGWVGFSVPMAHKVTAAADLLMMPSRFEPCGLNQLYAMRYGTLPIVHAVGGLRDTVPDFNPFEKTGFGWSFDRASAEGLRHATGNALDTYFNYKDTFRDIQRRSMEQDLSWNNAALQYEGVMIDAKYQW